MKILFLSLTMLAIAASIFVHIVAWKTGTPTDHQLSVRLMLNAILFAVLALYYKNDF